VGIYCIVYFIKRSYSGCFNIGCSEYANSREGSGEGDECNGSGEGI
jgi:hypothetical protein